MRCLRTAILFLLLGATVNVGVAWAIAVFSPLNVPAGTVFNELNDWHESNAHWERFAPANWPEFDGGFALINNNSLQFESLSSIDNTDFMIITTAGWPTMSLTGASLGPGGRMGPDVSQFHLMRRSIPYRPIPLWFAINTLFYATATFAIFCATASAKRRIRLRHGRCVTCRYPMGDSTVCTECGAELVR